MRFLFKERQAYNFGLFVRQQRQGALRQAQGDKVEVDVSGLKNGMYFVEVTSTSSVTGRKVERTKFVKE